MDSPSRDQLRFFGPRNALPSSAMKVSLEQPEIARLVRRLAGREPLDADEGSDDTPRAAVAAVLRVADAVPELLFIRRAERMGDPWSGHMAFPGGRHEPGDASLEMTAVRETREELALDLTQGSVLGRLDDLAPRGPSLPRMLIRPFVALVTPDVVIQPNLEVAAAYWVPVHVLQHQDSRVDHFMTLSGIRTRLPGFLVGGHVVWGLTERIVNQLLPLLSP